MYTPRTSKFQQKLDQMVAERNQQQPIKTNTMTTAKENSVCKNYGLKESEHLNGSSKWCNEFNPDDLSKFEPEVIYHEPEIIIDTGMKSMDIILGRFRDNSDELLNS
jgi:hypothetical protein